MNPFNFNDKVDDFIKNAVLYYLDQIESTVINTSYEKELISNNETSIYKFLCDKGLANNRIKALNSIAKELKQLKKCPNCNTTVFSVDCSMVVCTNCHHEFFIHTKETVEYCKECVGYTIGDCEAKSYIDSEDNK